MCRLVQVRDRARRGVPDLGRDARYHEQTQHDDHEPREHRDAVDAVRGPAIQAFEWVSHFCPSPHEFRQIAPCAKYRRVRFFQAPEWGAEYMSDKCQMAARRDEIARREIARYETAHWEIAG